MIEPHHSKFFEHVQRVPFYGIFIAILVAVLFVTNTILYEAKTALIQRYVVPNTASQIVPTQGRLVLSADSITRVKQFTDDHKELAIVGVISVDLTQNQRTAIIRFYNDKQMEKHVATQLKHLPESPVPLLIPRDEANNAQVSDLLNGEFTCSNAMDGLFAQLYGLDTQLKTVCHVPVPPYYGKLTGYLVMYSKQEMSIYEKDQLRAAAIKLAVDMYNADATRPYLGVSDR